MAVLGAVLLIGFFVFHSFSEALERARAEGAERTDVEQAAELCDTIIGLGTSVFSAEYVSKHMGEIDVLRWSEGKINAVGQCMATTTSETRRRLLDSALKANKAHQ